MKNTTVIAISISAVMLFATPFAFCAPDDAINQAIHNAESTLGARVGVAIIDTGSGRSWLHRADERFPMASTSKVLACAALLDSGAALMHKKTIISKNELQAYSPVTKKMIGTPVSAAELCSMTMRTSDNTAMNKVLELLGGPQAVTDFARKMGDQTSRLDRFEPSLNEGTPGDPRDTTTPRAISDTLHKLLLGTGLTITARNQLTEWLRNNEVGEPLLRAGIPATWRIADRTGAGGFGTRAIVAVMWPPQSAPLVAAVYVTETKASMDERNAAIASIGKAIAKEFQQ